MVLDTDEAWSEAHCSTSVPFGGISEARNEEAEGVDDPGTSGDGADCAAGMAKARFCRATDGGNAVRIDAGESADWAAPDALNLAIASLTKFLRGQGMVSLAARGSRLLITYS